MRCFLEVPLTWYLSILLTNVTEGQTFRKGKGALLKF